jgi:4-hydroxy-3-methylbut-2-enyl diphosphate reductase
MHLVETLDGRRAPAVRDPAKLAYVTQTTLSVDDAAQIVAALRARFPQIRGPEARRHLLRDAEPPGRSEIHGAALRRGDRGGLAQQLELEPAARSRAEHGRRRLHGRQAAELRPEWIAGKPRVGVTAGASRPKSW